MDEFYKDYELDDAEVVNAIRKAADDYEKGEKLVAANTLEAISHAIREYIDDEPLVHDQHLDVMAALYGLTREPGETNRQLKHRILDFINSRP